MAPAPLRVLSVIPPMAQLNSPYPATAHLTGFLRSCGVDAVQEDLALGLVLRVLSPEGLDGVLGALGPKPRRGEAAPVRSFREQFARYRATVGPAVRFLQGKDPTLAHRIAGRNFLPEGPRFEALEEFVGEEGEDPLAWAFGSLGVQDRAKHLATLYIDDLADAVREGVDPRFEFVRYAESLAQSQPTFDPLAEALAAPPTLLDSLLRDLVRGAFDRHAPRFLLLSAPFPGSVYGAFRIAQAAKALDPSVRTVLGGGFATTELRGLKDPRVFDLFDFVVLDAGERPLLALLEHLRGERPVDGLVRTFVRTEGGEVRFVDSGEPDVPFAETGTPTWDGLPLGDYLSVLDMLNPMHRLWSDGRWNKLAVARGCYWHRCSFCDVSLDYIARYEGSEAAHLVDQMEAVVAETGQSGFHFVDEAAPPKLLRALSEEILRRDLAVTWWVNIRFERAFTPQLCDLMARSGCIAVTGGLEVASDRLLGLIEKGVTVEQVARVTRAFSDAGILVHAYLMYGFPTQTLQETVDALEVVRQLFEAGCIQSGFFHRFACTVHSPVGHHPEKYGITLAPAPEVTFASNDVAFTDPAGADHEALAPALEKALYNFMHGIGLEEDVRTWFSGRVPATRERPDRIVVALGGRPDGNR